MSLSLLDFGRGAAQQEDNLREFFYRSGAYQQAVSGDIYLILGAKGAGKSAIFQRLKEEAGTIHTFREPSSMVADEPFIIRDLGPTMAEVSQSRTNVWKLYFASLAAERIVATLPADAPLSQKCKRFLARWGLVKAVPTKWQEYKCIKFDVGWEGMLKTEFPPQTKLTVGEVDVILQSVSQHYASLGGKLWICLDSLDEVALDGNPPASVEDILGDCMKAVGEIIRMPGIKVKLFFRTDIYTRLTYVNKDHFSSSRLELKWSRDDLSILLGHRLAKLHTTHTANVSVAVANEWIAQVFEWGGEVTSFEDLYYKLQDGLGNVLPRDLVHLCIQAKRIQEAFTVQETNIPTNGKLISKKAIDDALYETANAKLTDFLNVFRMFSSTMDQLRGHPTCEISRADLTKAFGKTDLDAALIIADLWTVGALKVVDKKAINHAQSFVIPYLYAKALDLGN